jgi:glutaminyl-tRNA synthetase
MAEEVKTPDTLEGNVNFIHAFCRGGLAPGGRFEGLTVHTRFPRTPTGTCISDMQRPSASILGRRSVSAGGANLRMDDTIPPGGR